MSADKEETDLGPVNVEEEEIINTAHNAEEDIPDLDLDLEVPFEEQKADESRPVSQSTEELETPRLVTITDAEARVPKIEREEPSTPDDTPSLQDSVLSSPRRSRLGSPGHSFPRFDRRFSARLSPSPLATPRPGSPAFLTGRSRQSSALNPFLSSENGDEAVETPWEVFRWTKLRKLSGDAFSELAKRNYGRPTCMAVASIIAIGTSKGLILIFDYHQNLKTIIGFGTKAVESGSITAISLSADHTIVAGGHINGNIFTWEIARPAKPFLTIPATNAARLQESGADGHVIDSAVLHLSFLGIRHTALVSADVKGMAFSHLATRGLGAIARSVKTARILGRYPETSIAIAKPRKPSSVIAFSSMPLGNSESPTDGLGLVAMLTPYLLVVVSTTPIAQTQHKASRPKELAAHGAMTGALAWYPSMKSKSGNSAPKLAYCWLNVVTIIEVIDTPNSNDENAPPDLNFKNVKQWKTEESIVAMQWLNRSVLAILTISQQLIILEDSSFAVTDTSDLIQRHIYHTDLFSQQLSQMIENLEQEDVTMHGVVADAFYMSFKAYKGRLFLLGFNDISIGTLSNWADRLLSLMEQGDFIGAIQQATSYYTGGAEKAAIGLPLDEESRHGLVQEKLVEMMAASLRYAFGKNPDAGSRVSDIQLEHLSQACFTACLQLNDMDFLFEEVYSWYAENQASQIFLNILETSIAEEEIKQVPPIVLKDLVNSFVDRGQNARLEEILCLLDSATMDLEQVTLLCRKFQLYDALLYIWSQAIGDYTTVMQNLLMESQTQDYDENENTHLISKIFPYLSYTLTGRVYPTGNPLPDSIAFKAKSEVYHFLFSGSDGKSYHHLRAILDLDTSSFLSMLNEAYEDSFLDHIAETGTAVNGHTTEERFAMSLTRQYIIRVLLEVLAPPEYDLEDTIYLDMFIARNQPKFPQFIRLPDSVLQKVLVNLCLYPSEEVAEDCQLSLEYLLSTYQPPDVSSLIPDLETARFYRVIKSIYRSEKQFARLLETCFKDIENPEAIFQCVRDCLRPNSEPSDKQREACREVLIKHKEELLAAGLLEAAETIDQYAPDLHTTLLECLEGNDRAQYEYLQQILQDTKQPSADASTRHKTFVERYIRLMCEFNPHHVSDYIDTLDSSDLQLDQILPALENSGAIDAAVILMARDGQISKAMDRLVQHMKFLEVALGSLYDGAAVAPDASNTVESAHDLVDSVEKYSKVGIWLCNTQSSSGSASQSPNKNKRISRLPSQALDSPLEPHEALWVQLVKSIVRVATNSNYLETSADPTTDDGGSIVYFASLNEVTTRLRNVVQDVFTALLVATSTSGKQETHSNRSFLRILMAFLSQAAESSPSLAHLRSVLGSIFSAYAYEENLLALSNRLLDKDLFVWIEEATERRKRGWRPSGQTCNGCGRRVWGPGTGVDAWNDWYDKQDLTNFKDSESHESKVNKTRSQNIAVGSGSISIPTAKSKGKGKEIAGNVSQDPPKDRVDGSMVLDPQANKISKDELIVFSCRHIWHRRCLQPVVHEENGGNHEAGSESLSCPLEAFPVDVN